MWNKQRYCGHLQNHVWIANFSGGNGKTPIPSKSSYFFMVLWHGWSCKEVCGTILWVGEQDDSTTLQRINSMPWWPSFQRRRIDIRGRIVKSMLLIFFWNAYTWHVSADLIFYGQWTHLHDRSQNGPNNVLMWETLQNNADWDCFKILTLREILKIRNPLQVEHCAFSEAIRLFQ